jgi:hypothetical protein
VNILFDKEMRAESTVPTEERVLFFEGVLKEDVFSVVKRGLPPGAKADECFFSCYTYADLPLPKIFDVVFDCNDPTKSEVVEVCIQAVTQQFAKPDDQVPHGWKMICWLGASARRSTLLQSLPRVSTWFEAKPKVGLCSQATWEAKKSNSEGSVSPQRETGPGLNKPFD